MKHISTSDFQTQVLEHKGTALVDFYADWCGPCRILGPMLEQLDKENKDENIKFFKINVDENQQLSAMFGVMSIPTVIIFKDGKIVAQKVGVQPKEMYSQALTNA